MSVAEGLENFYKILLGAALAFFFCFYAWEIEHARDAAAIVVMGWAICFFWSRNLRKKESKAHG